MSKSAKGEKELLQDYQDDIDMLDKWIIKNQKKIQDCKDEIDACIAENKSFVERKAVLVDKMTRVKEEIDK